MSMSSDIQKNAIAWWSNRECYRLWDNSELYFFNSSSVKFSLCKIFTSFNFCGLNYREQNIS